MSRKLIFHSLAVGLCLAGAATVAAIGFDPGPVYLFSSMLPMILATAVAVVAIAAMVRFGGLTRLAVLTAFETLSRIRHDAFRQEFMARSLT